MRFFLCTDEDAYECRVCEATIGYSSHGYVFNEGGATFSLCLLCGDRLIREYSKEADGILGRMVDEIKATTPSRKGTKSA